MAVGGLLTADPKCQCQTWPDSRSERCTTPCRNPLSTKHSTFCRPCAVGNHTGQPCSKYVPEPTYWIVKTCVSCGFQHL